MATVTYMDGSWLVNFGAQSRHNSKTWKLLPANGSIVHIQWLRSSNELKGPPFEGSRLPYMCNKISVETMDPHVSYNSFNIYAGACHRKMIGRWIRHTFSTVNVIENWNLKFEITHQLLQICNWLVAFWGSVENSHGGPHLINGYRCSLRGPPDWRNERLGRSLPFKSCMIRTSL